MYIVQWYIIMYNDTFLHANIIQLICITFFYAKVFIVKFYVACALVKGFWLYLYWCIIICFVIDKIQFSFIFCYTFWYVGIYFLKYWKKFPNISEKNIKNYSLP